MVKGNTQGARAALADGDERAATRNIRLERGGPKMSPLEEIPGTVPFCERSCSDCDALVGPRSPHARRCARCAQKAGVLYEAMDSKATLAITLDRLARELHQHKLALLSVFATPRRCPICDKPFAEHDLFAWRVVFPFEQHRDTWRHNCAADVIAQVNYGS